VCFLCREREISENSEDSEYSDVAHAGREAAIIRLRIFGGGIRNG
jgi:hypothetical protein